MMDVYVYIQRQTKRDARRRDFQEGTGMFQVCIISRIIPTNLPLTRIDRAYQARDVPQSQPPSESVLWK